MNCHLSRDCIRLNIVFTDLHNVMIIVGGERASKQAKGYTVSQVGACIGVHLGNWARRLLSKWSYVFLRLKTDNHFTAHDTALVFYLYRSRSSVRIRSEIGATGTKFRVVGFFRVSGHAMDGYLCRIKFVLFVRVEKECVVLRL